VDHLCEKCGVAVEDGRPFCPHCRAPQIHVEVAVTPGPAAVSQEGTAPFMVSHAHDFGRVAESRLGGDVDGSVARRAALKAGVLGLFIGIIPVLGILLTGSLAVYFYKREKGYEPGTSAGSRLGAAAGVVTFAINSLFIVVRVFAFHAQQEYIDWILKIAQTTGYNTADPEIQSSVHNLFTPGGLTLLFFFVMILTVALAAAGGALGSIFLRKPPNR
jgi:hypothetical protein